MLPQSAVHPILLPKRSHFTDLVIRSQHEKSLHQGTSYTIAVLRQRYWIPSARSIINTIIRRCVICLKDRGKPYNVPNHAPLPYDRVNIASPFEVTGIDLTGSIIVKLLKNNKETIKVYIVAYYLHARFLVPCVFKNDFLNLETTVYFNIL